MIKWNKLKYWQKGAVIGAIVYGSYGTVAYLIAPLCGWDCWELYVLTLSIQDFLVRFIHSPVLYVWDSSALDTLDFWVWSLSSLLLGFLGGSVIGYIIGKYKQSR